VLEGTAEGKGKEVWGRGGSVRGGEGCEDCR